MSPRTALTPWLLGTILLSVVVLMFGELLRIPQWIQNISPFEHLPLMPAEDFRWAPVVAVALVAGALSVAGQWAFTRRDVRSG